MLVALCAVLVPAAGASASVPWEQRGAAVDGAATGDHFGYGTAISDDGRVVAVGASRAAGGGINRGIVRVLAWDGTAWTQRGGTITGSVDGDAAGRGIALSGAGDVLVVSSYIHGGGGTDRGQVRVFAWDGSAWVQRGADILGTADNDFAGASVAIDGAGTRVAIGETGHTVGTDAYVGRVRVFDWNGTSWVQAGSSFLGDISGDQLGNSVSLSDDGLTLAVGMPFYMDGQTTARPGQVRVYAWSGSNWVAKGASIVGPTDDDRFGNATVLSGDGQTLVVAPEMDTASSGKGYAIAYRWNATSATWEQRGAVLTGESANDNFGTASQSVAVSEGGTRIAIGAPYADGANANVGRVRIFDWDAAGAAWQQVEAISGTDASEESGWSVSLSGDGSTVAIGTMRYSSYTGRLRVFAGPGAPGGTTGGGAPADGASGDTAAPVASGSAAVAERTRATIGIRSAQRVQDTVVVRVAVSGPGRVTIVGRRVRSGPPTVVACERAEQTVARAGTVTITCRLTRGARVARSPRLVRIAVALHGSDGTSARSTHTLRVGPAAS